MGNPPKRVVYQKLIRRYFKRSGEINYNTLFYLLQAYQPKASIFNPYSIKWIMDQVIDHYLGYKGKSKNKLYLLYI